jgi:diguanylate cyclase (GGDEF)-like protein/PAS domain S-box-containing protein
VNTPNSRRYMLSVLARFLMYFIVSAAGVIVALTSLEYQKFNLEKTQSQEEESLRLSLASQVLKTDLREPIEDVRTIASLQVLSDYLHQETTSTRTRVEKEFLNFAQHTRVYDQIRYIDPSGMERVRVNFNGRVAVPVPLNQLQNKSQRYYFREARQLKANEIYISPLDLNVETEQIERPYKPMIRVATPVYISDQFKGIVILNYLAGPLIEDFKEFMSKSWGEPMLVNPQGYWLYSPTKQDEWGFMLDHDESFAKRYPKEWDYIIHNASGTVQTPAGLFIFATVQPYALSTFPGATPAKERLAERFWKLITLVSPHVLSYSPLSLLQTRPRELTGLLLLVGILSITLAWLRSNYVAKVNALRESEQRLAEAQRVAHVGNWIWEIPTGKLSWSDEIYRIFGREPQQFVATYEEFLAAVHPDDRDKVSNAVNAAVYRNAPYVIDHRVVHPNGTIRHVHERAVLRFDAAGKPVRMLGTIQDITERKQTDQALRNSEERLRDLVRQASDGIFVADLNGRYTDVNDAGCRMLGYTREEIVGKTIIDFIPPTDAGRLWQSKEQMLQGNVHVAEWTLRRKDGTYLPVEVSAKILPDGRWQGFVRDISERKRTEEQLRQAATVFNSTMEAIIIANAERKIVAVNQAYTNITGFETEEVLGEDPRVHQSGRHDDEFYREIWESLARTGQWQGEIWNRRKSGEVFPAWENISVVKDDEGRITNYVSVLSDISTIKQAEERLSQLAHHDALTGLPNRLAFSANLEQALERAKRHKQKVALLFLDLDRFKVINDTLGHAAGDRLLQAVSTRLKECVRAEDTVARLGGDEFTVILGEITQPEDAALLARKIIDAINDPILIEDREVLTSTSIGISIYPDDARNAEDLSKAADAAMYRAKERGRHTYEFYTEELTSMAYEHLAIEDALRQALVRNEFVLHYQPLLDLKQHKIVGVEALLRWQHPEKGLISPDLFIAVAEESGLIQPIGDWVLREACLQAAKWRAAGMPALRVAINLSGRQILRDDFAAAVHQAITQCGVRPAELHLEFEVTERMLYSTERGVDTLRKLKSLGVNIAIDDFGTGYSSLSQLKLMPVDTLKIDRAFMHDIPDDPGNQAIAAAIISLGHTLNLNVVAEGVETTAQLKFLEALGCDQGQGYLFSKPVSQDRIRHLVEAAA